jgi:hypothetical protein
MYSLLVIFLLPISFFDFLYLFLYQTIDGIIDIAQSLNSSQLGNNNLLQRVAHSVLLFLSNSRPWYISSNTVPIGIGVLFLCLFHVLFCFTISLLPIFCV